MLSLPCKCLQTTRAGLSQGKKMLPKCAAIASYCLNYQGGCLLHCPLGNPTTPRATPMGAPACPHRPGLRGPMAIGTGVPPIPDGSPRVGGEPHLGTTGAHSGKGRAMEGSGPKPPCALSPLAWVLTRACLSSFLPSLHFLPRRRSPSSHAKQESPLSVGKSWDSEDKCMPVNLPCDQP